MCYHFLFLEYNISSEDERLIPLSTFMCLNEIPPKIFFSYSRDQTQDYIFKGFKSSYAWTTSPPHMGNVLSLWCQEISMILVCPYFVRLNCMDFNVRWRRSYLARSLAWRPRRPLTAINSGLSWERVAAPLKMCTIFFFFYMHFF